MTIRLKNRSLYAATLLLSGLLLVGCDTTKSDKTTDAGTETETATETGAALSSYEVTVVNVTNKQPFSPLTVVTHSSNYSLWKIGSPASSELEWLAEEGSNNQLQASLANVDATFASGAADYLPGATAKLTITVSAATQDRLTIASMLVNSNDAFVGLNAFDLSTMNVGDVKRRHAVVYDAGTELNDEAMATIPGPAAGGEAYNAERSDPQNFVRGHAGVLTLDDGMPTSILTEEHRFNNPALFVMIKRIK